MGENMWIKFLQLLHFRSTWYFALFRSIDDNATHTLSGRVGKVVASHADWRLQARFTAEAAPIYSVYEGAQGVLPMMARGVTSQLDLQSLTPLSVAGCGRLQLGVAHQATSVALLQLVDNWPD